MSTIITRNSATSGSSPSSLVQGELAINVTDNRLFFGSGSGNVVKEFGVSASYALSASYAATASFAPLYLPLAGGTISGNVTVLGTASINTLIVNQIGYSSGSNQLGDAANDTQTLYGTVVIPTGSLTVTGSINTTGGVTGSLLGTASYATQALSASYALTASYALNAGDSVWTASGADIYYNSGNVGIGTSSPAVVLDVAKTLNNSYIRINSTGNYETGYQIYNGGAIKWQMYVPNSSNDLRFYDGSDNRVTFQYGGNVGIGTLTPAYKLSVVGKMALNDGGNSVFIGDNAGQSDDATANLNVAIGTSALQNNLTGASNVAVGNLALNTNLGSTNTALGANALQLNTTGVSNTAVGASSQLNSGVGTFNTSVGTNTLLFCASGSSNAAFGSSALRSLTSGSNNVALGASALFTITSGIDNTAVGTNAISNNTTGSDNTALGRNAGRYFSTGTSANANASASIFIGKNSRANASGETNQIVIGSEALGLGNNTIVLGNDAITTTALKGNVGIGKTNPSTKLDVNGNTTVTGSLLVTGSVYINNALYSNQTTTLATENKVVYSVPTATYNAIFVDYVVVNGSNVRAGQIVSATDGTDKTYTETTTTDIGSSTPVTFNVSISGGNFQLEASASTSTWTVKTTTRVL